MNGIAEILRPPGLPVASAVECQVLLDEIEVMADIGAFSAEHGVPQPLRIHVALSIVPPVDDDLSQTFDYSRIHAHALELASQRIALIETFAQRLARMCLACDLVTEAAVRIDKPRAVPGCLAGTRIRIRRE
ncbi:dihydroneopterin aldolase [Novosphingobium resinovorum]|uniref:dihydroneopterin aldolase n=1 Tax=Novosphingobium resinovorum TaxID=158500 RepID=UPI002ED41F4F|nr:dihydroneopterin aldolase [Novosphingobium resinovorum]